MYITFLVLVLNNINGGWVTLNIQLPIQKSLMEIDIPNKQQ